MKRLLLASALVAAVAIAPAQSLNEYLRVRKQNHVDHPVDVSALQDVSGSKVMELRAVVKGTFRQGNRITLLVGRPDGETQDVEADVVPEWLLIGDNVTARLLVRAIQPTDGSPFHVVLLSAAKDEDIKKLEDAEAAKHPKPKPTSPRSTEPRRDIRNGLYGPIGRHQVARQEWVEPAYRATRDYAAYIKKINPRLENGQAIEMANCIIGYCIRYHVNPRLVMSVAIVESGFDAGSVSHSGAMGIGQLMPGTARWMGVANPFDVVDNIYGMVKLLRTHSDEFGYPNRDGSLPLVLAAYNAGDGAVKRYGGVPPYRETQAYVRHVLALFDRLGGE